MRRVLKLFLKSIPVAVGIILTLISFVLIVDLGYIDIEESKFWGFVFFELLGIPSIFVGIGILCR